MGEYESFIENTLKKELKKALDNYRGDAEVLAQCKELRENIDLLLRDNVAELETMIELGCGFYAKALVPDTSKIFVNVGLGFQLEMPLAEAHDFLGHKESYIVSRLERQKTRIAQVKADIHEALHLLDLMFQVRSGRAPH